MKIISIMINNNKIFFNRLIRIGFPILLQNIISSSLSFVDVFMVGQLGKVSVAAVGIGTQISFVFLMLLSSLTSGVSIFTAQYWGKKDLKSIHSLIGIGFLFCFTATLIFSFFVLTFTNGFVSLYSTDIEVIRLSSSFTKIISVSFIFMSFSNIYSSILRSTEFVRFPVIISSMAVLINTFFNYVLIFGHFGLPKLGVEGAAIATLISRIIECIILFTFGYVRKYPVNAPFNRIFSFNLNEIKKYCKITIPIIGQTMGWTIGASVYIVIYGHISTEALAAYNIAASVELICTIVFTSMGLTCSIVLGKKIGENELSTARDYSKNYIKITIIVSIILSIILLLSRNLIISFYNIDVLTESYLYNILFVMAMILVVRAINIIFIMGIFKAGGDTFFSMLIDVGGIWLIGIPLGVLAAFVFCLPVYYVLLFTSAEEFVKTGLFFYRYSKNQWIHNLTLSKRRR